VLDYKVEEGYELLINVYNRCDNSELKYRKPSNYTTFAVASNTSWKAIKFIEFDSLYDTLPQYLIIALIMIPKEIEKQQTVLSVTAPRTIVTPFIHLSVYNDYCSNSQNPTTRYPTSMCPKVLTSIIKQPSMSWKITWDTLGSSWPPMKLMKARVKSG